MFERQWSGASGLAEDVRYYGNLIRKRAIVMIGHLYPKVKLPKEYGRREANVIAWIWARTVASPNPAAQGSHVNILATRQASWGHKVLWFPTSVPRFF